jgi:ATP-dependent Clp endopeptidase proteolytic subunit ClpP
MGKHTKDDIDKLHDYSIYTPARIIYMGSESENENTQEESGTDYAMAERLIKNMLILEHISSEPITIIMDNLGGDWYHGIGIYEKIKQSKCHVTIKIYGQAMSMGSIIAQAADHRVMTERSRMMIHYGDAGASSVSKNFQRIAKEYERTDSEMEEILLEHIKAKNPEFKLKDLKKMLLLDTYLSASEALDLGLIDEIEGKSAGDSAK